MLSTRSSVTQCVGVVSLVELLHAAQVMQDGIALLSDEEAILPIKEGIVAVRGHFIVSGMSPLML
jgi:hypothetical protein